MDAYLGEVRLVGFNFAPVGWATCDGQLLPIAQNDALFSLLGTTFGGDGVETFALPDLRGRLPVHAGQGTRLSNRVAGQAGGAEAVTLTAAQMPAHTHTVQATETAASSESPAGNAAAQSETNIYIDVGPFQALNAGSVLPVGGGQPHDNMHPYQVVNFIIATEGVFPPQS